MLNRRFFAFFLLAAICGSLVTTGCSGKSSATGPPTEAEIKATIEKAFKETYGQDYGGAKLKEVTITFPSAPQIGSQTKTQVGRGEEARPVWPVKIPVKITVTYSNNPSSRNVERGVKSDDVFFFYKDAFNAWNFRTGSL